MQSPTRDARRRSNLRLGIILGTIAVAFFFAVIAKKIWVG